MSTPVDDFSSIDINKRLSAAIEACGLNQREAADRIGVARSYVSDLCRGAKSPGTKVLAGLTEHYGISASWILCGQGPMLLRDLEAGPRQASPVSPPPPATLTPAPPLASDIEVRWGELATATRTATLHALDSWGRDGLELLRQASVPATPTGPSRTHHIYGLVDELVTSCPSETTELLASMIETTLRRCAGEQIAKSA